MVISFEKKFLFIHVIKTAGISIENALWPYDVRAESDQFLGKATSSIPRDPNAYSEILEVNRYRDRHIRALHVQRILGEEAYGKLYKFAFMRNPWAHALSGYNFRMANLEKHDPHGLAAKANNFEDYILTNFQGIAARGIQAVPIVDQERKVIVDCIYKYENLADSFSSICKKLNIEAELPHLNSTKKVDFKDHYTLEMFNLVRDHVRLDIEIGGYSDDPAVYGIE